MLMDNALRYGAVTRSLHWAMAALFAWQFAGVALKYVLGRVPLMAFWVGTHPSVGTLILLLALVRLGWAISQRDRRPAYGGDSVARLAKTGHAAIYLLMIVVPALGLLRMFGDVRPVSLFGVLVRPEGAQEILWMTAPADLVHSWLAWLLLALIAGHIAMVIVHRFLWRDDILGRMVGRAS